MTGPELRLDEELQAVRRARRFLDGELAGQGADLRQDAGLVLTELVTNAMLHGAFPITVRVRRTPGRLRIEVADAGRDLPIRLHSASDAMSGRGLGLIAALALRWGVTPERVGKAVWAELADGTGAIRGAADRNDPHPARMTSESSAEELYTIVLGSVPTDLLLAAKAHIDNLVREFTFAAAASEQNGKQLPAHLAELVHTVVHGFAAARSQIKRQAAEAAESGAAQTHLVLRLPLSAADAGEQYLAALDVADRHARAARLLTLETPPLHRVFRHWYVGAVATQLRRAAAGVPPGPVEGFPQRLADESRRPGRG